MELILELYDLLEKDTPGLKMGAFVLNPDAGTIFTKIGGKTYEFKPKDKDKDVTELHKSVVGIAKHSQGRALAYLKQHAKGTPIKESLQTGADFAVGDKVTVMKDLKSSEEPDWWPLKKYINKSGTVAKVLGDEIKVKMEDGKVIGFDVSEVVKESLEIAEDLQDQVTYEELKKFDDALIRTAKKKKSKGFDVTMIGSVNVYHIKGKYFAAWNRKAQVGIIDPDFDGSGMDLIDELKKLKESAMVEDLQDQTVYTDPDKLDAAVQKIAVEKKIGTYDITRVRGAKVYHNRSKYFAAWNPQSKKGIIDPYFRGNAFELLTQLDKSIIK